MLRKNERSSVVSDKEKRKQRFPQMFDTESKNLNLRYKPRNGKTVLKIFVYVCGYDKDKSAMGDLFSDCIVLGVK